MKGKENWWDSASARGLLIVAVAGIVFDVLHKFGMVSWINPEDVVIVLMAFLCLAYASERVLVLRKIWDSSGQVGEDIRSVLNALAKIDKKVETNNHEIEEKVMISHLEILNRLDATIKAEALIGTNAIEEAATKIIRASSSSHEIIATSEQDSFSDEYLYAMAERVKRAVSDKGEMEVRVVMSAKTDSEQVREDRRTQIFRDRGIDDRLNTRRAKHGWPLDVLIVGNAMIIALRRGGKRATYEVAIEIQDQEFVGRASKWFREEVWGEADEEDQ